MWSLLFLCAFLSVVSIAPITWNALFWIIMLFASINAVSKSFLQESKGRQLYIYTIASPLALIISKTIYNVLLMMVLTIVALCFYMLVFDYVPRGPGFVYGCSHFREFKFFYHIHHGICHIFKSR